MSQRTSVHPSLTATLAVLALGAITSVLLAGCASVGSQPAVYTEKAQKPCPSQSTTSPASNEPCKKSQ